MSMLASLIGWCGAAIPAWPKGAARPKPEVVLIDRPMAAMMHSTMTRALREWGGIARLEANARAGRSQRLIARAYADVFGVVFADANDDLPGGALTPKELRRLPELRRVVRRLHPETRFLNKVSWAIRTPLAKGAVASLRGAVEVLLPFIAAPFAVQPILIYVPLMYVFFGLAFGFWTPFHYAGLAIHWMVAHPSQTWLGVRCLAGFMFIYVVVYCWTVLFPEEPSSASGSNSTGGGNGFGPYAIRDFREASPFGDANLAQKQAITRALQGHNVPNSPRFEE